MTDQRFDAASLHALREAVLAYATAAGMPERRAIDVMIAVHELAANAVRHGAGWGRLRMRITAGALYCQVTDAGPASLGSQDSDQIPAPARPWPFQRGHGLWLVRKAADRISVNSGPGRSEVTVVFTVPATP